VDAADKGSLIDSGLTPNTSVDADGASAVETISISSPLPSDTDDNWMPEHDGPQLVWALLPVEELPEHAIRIVAGADERGPWSSSGIPQNEDANDALARIDQRLGEIARVLRTRDFPEASPSNPVTEIANVAADRGRAAISAGRTRVTEASILEDVVLVERAARRLRKFVTGLTDKTVEIAPPPKELSPSDEAMRERARRALARSGFVRIKP